MAEESTEQGVEAREGAINDVDVEICAVLGQ